MASGVSTRTANRMNAGALISHGGTNACHGARVLINAPLSFDFVDSIVLAMARFLNHAHGITMPVDANRLPLRHRFRALRSGFNQRAAIVPFGRFDRTSHGSLPESRARHHDASRCQPSRPPPPVPFL